MWRIFAGPGNPAACLVSAQAQENVPLKPGAGMETVEANCGSLSFARLSTHQCPVSQASGLGSPWSTR